MKRFGLMLVLLLASCGPSPQDVEATAQAGIRMTQTARPTATPASTATRTPKPTSTPRPTPTSRPTPAPPGVAVPYGPLEITLLSALERDTMHIGDIEGRYYIYYYAPEGARMIDLAVLVHNTDADNPYPVKWNDIFVVEDNGDSWYPMWAKVKSMPEDGLADPYSIGISSEEVDPDGIVDMLDYTYMRLVYMVRDKANQEILFHVSDSPRIQFQTERGP